MQSKLVSIYPEQTTIGSSNNVGALDNHSLPRHRWYFIKEAFSPQVVQVALKESLRQRGQWVVDPFSGSGTSVLTSTLNGFNGVGFEVNPFLAFVSKTKLSSCNPFSLEKYLPAVTKGVKRGAISGLEIFSTFSKKKDAQKWLFNRDVLRAFEGGWQATESIPEPAQNLLKLSLIGAAMDVCNAEKDGKCLRYKKDWEKLGFGQTDFTSAFEARLEMVKSDIKDCPIESNESRIYRTDSRQEKTWLRVDNKYKLCVMSPPYLNSFDYSDVYRPELFLGKFVKKPEELVRLRLQTLRSHVQVKWPDPLTANFGSQYARSLKKIEEHADSLWNKRIPLMIKAYFEDMKSILANLLIHTLPEAQVWIVVSTSSYAGIEIPVDSIIADIGEQIGWHLKELSTIRYLRRTAGQQWDRLSEAKQNKPHLRESLILLERRKNSTKKL